MMAASRWWCSSAAFVILCCWRFLVVAGLLRSPRLRPAALVPVDAVPARPALNHCLELGLFTGLCWPGWAGYCACVARHSSLRALRKSMKLVYVYGSQPNKHVLSHGEFCCDDNPPPTVRHVHGNFAHLHTPRASARMFCRHIRCRGILTSTAHLELTGSFEFQFLLLELKTRRGPSSSGPGPTGPWARSSMET